MKINAFGLTVFLFSLQACNTTSQPALPETQVRNTPSHQQNLLLNPSDSQLKAEGNGRVMIYDQLKNDMVEQALNQQFDRIENMMFVRMQHVQEDGQIEFDDDCD